MHVRMYKCVEVITMLIWFHTDQSISLSLFVYSKVFRCQTFFLTELNIQPSLPKTESLNQDLSYGEILAGRPGSWLVKKLFFLYACYQKSKKGTYVEIQNDFQNMFSFYDSIYGLCVKGPYWCLLWWHLPWKKWLQ